MKLCTGTIVSAALVYGADKALAASPDAMYSTFETYDGILPCGRLKHRRHMCYSIPPTVTQPQPTPSQ